MEVRRAHPFGVEVRDVNVCTLTDQAFREIEDVFDVESLLLFRNQSFTYDEGRDFFARFGPMVKGVRVVTHESANGRGELDPHHERSYQREEPIRGLALCATEVPDSGGATVFVNCAAACRALPADLNDQLHRVDTVHRNDPAIRIGVAEYHKLIATYGLKAREVPEGGWWTTHPAIFRHPITGTPIVYLNDILTEEDIIGVAEDVRGPLLSRLIDHMSDPAFRYRHVWQTGDLVLWDNFVLTHAREAYDESKPRVLWKYEFGLREGIAIPDPHSAAVS